MAITLENRIQKTETGRKPESGFALLIAVIFMSVMLSFGLALGSLGYKQQVLASGAIASQYAFYAADTALECALYADQRQSSFIQYPLSNPILSSVPPISCDGAARAPLSSQWDASRWIIKYQFLLDAATTHPRCADVTVYKYSQPQPNGAITYIFSQGYDVPCDTIGTNARFVSRGIIAHY